MFRMRMVLLVLIALLVALAGPGPAAAAGSPRIDLRVLVLTDGSAWVEGIRQQLDAEGVPSTVVTLADPARPVITSAFLADQLADGTPHAKFDGVVVPGSGVSADELAALAAFEAQFGIRQVDAFSFPSAAVGLNAPAFAGSLDGVTATVTPAGLGDAFRYLTGPVAFEDNDPAVAESFGYLTTPLPDDPATGSHFEPIVTAAAPGTATQHVIAGVHRSGGRGAAGPDVRLQLPPAAVPPARPRRRQLADPRHPPRLLAQLPDRAHRRPVQCRRSVERHGQVHAR